MQLATVSRLGPYEIVSLLSAGGMGQVYRVRDTRLDRAVHDVGPSILSSSMSRGSPFGAASQPARRCAWPFKIASAIEEAHS